MRTTPDQQRVIDRVSGEMVVLASAGSGKTYAIVERYLNLVVNHGVRPSEILTTTFTKKAASEMKSRIVDRLRGAGLHEFAQEAETGAIQTLHSFFETVLRENAIIAGLDPKFTVIEPKEMTWIVRSALRRSIVSGEAEDPLVGEFLAQFVGEFERDSSSAYGVVESKVNRLLDLFRQSGCEISALAELYEDPVRLIEKSYRQVLDCIPERFGSNEPRSSELDLYQTLAAIRAFIEAARVKGKYKWVFEPPLGQADTEANARRLCGLVHLTLETWHGVSGELSKLQALDFASLESQAVTLLERHPEVVSRVSKQFKHVMIDEAQDVNPVQYRFIDSLKPTSMLLVGDDKQSIFRFRNSDVELFRSRAAGQSIQLAENHRSDESIQRFVDRVFQPHIAEYAPMMVPASSQIDGTGGVTRGDEQFEADPFVSAPQYAGGIGESTFAPETFEGVQYWHLPGPSAWQDLGGFVQQLIDTGVAEAREIAVLTMFRKTGADLESAFSKVGIGVKLNSSIGAYYECLEIGDLSCTLDALCDPGDDFSHLVMLRSPVVGLSLDAITLLGSEPPSSTGDKAPIALNTVRMKLDTFKSPVASDVPKLERFRHWFNELQSYADRLPASEILERVIAESALMGNLAKRVNGRQRIENVRKLLVNSSEHSELSAVEYTRRMSDLREFGVGEGNAAVVDASDDLVTISTIHGAKGLEWKVVIIADAMNHWVGSVRNYAFDVESGWIQSVDKSTQLLSSHFIATQNKVAETEELVRKQYVALTRARKLLVLVGWTPLNNRTGGLIGMVSAALGESFESLHRVESRPNE